MEGKVALVTGAGSPIGLGRNMAEALVQAGARVALMDVNRDWLEESANDLREIGGDDRVLTIDRDVSAPEDAEEAVGSTIAGLGGLHILVNNAGTNAHKWGAPGPNFWDITPEIWTKVMSINLNGPFFMARAAVSHLRAQGWGRIIGVTTSMDTMIRQSGTPYGPSKAGHEALIAAMAGELEGSGVTANVLVPGGRTNTNLAAGRPQRRPFRNYPTRGYAGTGGLAMLRRGREYQRPALHRPELGRKPAPGPTVGKMQRTGGLAAAGPELFLDRRQGRPGVPGDSGDSGERPDRKVIENG